MDMVRFSLIHIPCLVLFYVCYRIGLFIGEERAWATLKKIRMNFRQKKTRNILVIDGGKSDAPEALDGEDWDEGA